MNAHGDPSVEARSFGTFLGAFRGPVSRAQLSRFAQELGFRSSSERPYSVRIINRWLAELEDAGWVEFRPKKFVVGAADRRCALGIALREQYEPMALQRAMEVILPLPVSTCWSMTLAEAETVLAHAWLALLLDDEATLLSCAERLDDPHELFGPTQQLALIEDLSPDDLDHLPFRSLRHGLAQSLLSGTLLALPAEAAAERTLEAPVSERSSELSAALGLYLLACGEAEFGFHEFDLYAKTTSPVDPIVLATQATLGYVSGCLEPGQAARALDGALRAYRKKMGERDAVWPHVLTPFHAYILLCTGKAKDRTRATRMLDDCLPADGLFEATRHLGACCRESEHALLERDASYEERWRNDESLCPWNTLFTGLARHAMSLPVSELFLTGATLDAEDAEQAGYSWLADRLVALSDPERGLIESTRAKVPARWERDLERLEELVAKVSASDDPLSPRTPESTSRLVFTVNKDRGFALEPRLQKRNKKGWTKGRKVALKTLFQSPPDYATSEDVRVLQHIRRELELTYGYYRNFIFTFDDDSEQDLIGHPRVALSTDPLRFLPVVKRHPGLRLEQTAQGLRLAVDPDTLTGSSIRLEDDVLAVYVVKPAQREVLREMSKLKGVFPSEARERLGRLLGALVPILPVEADALADSIEAVEVEADSTPRFRLRREEEGLRLQIRVAPLGTDGAVFVPGEGSEQVLGQRSGRTVRARRELLAERERAEAAKARCSTLVDELPGASFILPSSMDCLDCLFELRALGDEVIVEWPEGDPIRIHYAGARDVRVRITARTNWLEPHGEVSIDGEQVIEMKALLAALAARPSRYVKLEDGSFLALERALMVQLSTVAAFTLPETGQGSAGRLHPLATLVMPALEEHTTLEGNEAFLARLAAAKDSAQTDAPIPRGLRAELRPYQVEGFRWLVRLSMFGAGACLADDMGLGKTVQALALLLHRAGEGPALVVAPTSVCGNWREEARRFAPDLRIFELRGPEALDDLGRLGACDVVVTSYGVLVREAARLAAVPFSTVVLDEAQAIKNASTIRAKAAFSLDAGMRVATTGTPIENHLGELHSLFRFLEPALLGSRESFRKRFADPIERHHDNVARQQLRDRVTPFILRRTKTKVLEELPARTDVTLRVRASVEQRAFYEALRQRMVEKIEQGKDEGGGAHLRVLAALTRLRQACCHPDLVVRDSGIPSAKMEAFLELLEELREGGHRALVFSQFVKHLALVRTELDRLGVPYQYLDGSTPARQRDSRVRAFQAGEGDAFLISLKAGGTGLNLTGADYVVHLDPWWNPAVEDQATDRAHRIGQTRPVTAYRLILEGTVEQRILELHREKRDLADRLLSGTEHAGRLSLDDMLDLLRNSAN